MSTFRTVLGFEIARTLKKKSFWIGALAVPILVVAIAAVQFLSAQSAQDTSQAQAEQAFDWVYVDDSQLIVPEIAAAAGGAPVDTVAEGEASFQAGEVAAFVHYPADPTTEPIVVAGAHEGVFADNRYGSVASTVLSASARAAVGSDELVSIAQGGFQVETTTYLADGTVSSALQALPVGILMLVLFFLVVVLLGNPVLIATTEEKENRVAEILLTTAKPNSVIAAKLVALCVIALAQIAVVVAPIAIGWLLFREQLQFGEIDLSTLVFEPQMIIIGLLILLSAAALYIASLAAVGASAPSAKEAGGFSFAAIFVPLVPLYLIAMIMSTPEAPLVQFLTYFPFTAGTTALVRNAFGGLELWEGLLVVAVLALSAVIALQLTTRIFRRGALQYDRALSWREIVGRRG
ncbi:MAG TPA: ABC transporter permease [Microbacteriaceae bacterium]|nr:ABC transporter permease [Microbacteriaceae bacterium]